MRNLEASGNFFVSHAAEPSENRCSWVVLEVAAVQWAGPVNGDESSGSLSEKLAVSIPDCESSARG